MGIHRAGDIRPQWTADEHRTTMVMFVEGIFRVDLTPGSITLERRGDYVVWGPGIAHSWHALSDSVVVRVRRPSSTS